METLEHGNNDPPQEKVEEEEPDRVSASLNGKTVLLTGGTGFMGTVVIEKILRVSPEIKQLIIIIRHKKGKEPRDRLGEIFKTIIFDKLIEDRGLDYLFSKTTCVTGDMAAPDLAMSDSDREICKTANIILHCAANVRFDQDLKDVVFLNTRGTKLMLDLAKECKNLELFIHVSTAYCHPDVQVLEEKCYPPPADPYFIINLMENCTDDFARFITPKLLGSWPNTYVYTKALAETLVEHQMQNIRALILRPSVVVPIYKEPVPGWTSTINGPAGLIIAAARGALRTMYGIEDRNADFIPVDIFANAVMICICFHNQIATMKEMTYKSTVHPRVCNLTSSDEIRLTWGEGIALGLKLSRKIPLTNAIWYPGGSMTRYKIVHQIKAVLFHWIPAIIVDTIMYCTGFTPVFIKVHKRIQKGLDVFEYYTVNQWTFRGNSKEIARELMNKTEKKNYMIEIEKDFSIEKFFEIGGLAGRRILMNQSDDSIPMAIRYHQFLWFLDMAVKILFFVLIIRWTIGFDYFISIWQAISNF